MNTVTKKHIDSFLKTDAFRNRLPEADEYAAANNLDKWSTRILWICLSEGVDVGRRFAMRRSDYRNSVAWNRYSRLLKDKWISESPPGFPYDPEANPEWEENPLVWFNHIANAITPAT